MPVNAFVGTIALAKLVIAAAGHIYEYCKNGCIHTVLYTKFQKSTGLTYSKKKRRKL